MSIEYKTACEAWEATDAAILQDTNKEILGLLPPEFLRRGVVTTTIEYLRFVVRELLSLPATAEIGFCLGDQQFDNESQALVTAGIYTYSFPSSYSPEPLKGPQGKSLSRPYRDTDGSSTVSRSSRSSVNQNKFRERLFLRDGRCLVTGSEDEEGLVAAHTVPQSLGQSFLDALTTYPRQVTLYSVTNGLLLRPDLHIAYDRYLWSIYVDPVGRYFIHVFGVNYREYHGNEIQHRTSTKSRLPNVSLLRWHYQQCLMARVRGYHVKPSERESH